MTNETSIRGHGSRFAILCKLLSAIAGPLLVALGGLAVSLFAGPPIKWFFQFIGTLGLWSLVATVKGELQLVVWFQLDEGSLEYRRLSRHTSEWLALVDVTDVDSVHKGNTCRLAVRSHDAHSLIFDSACMAGVFELRAALAERPQAALDSTGRIAGGDDAGDREIDFAMHSMRRALCVGLVLLGVFLLYLALACRNLIQNPGVFLALGILFAVSGVAGYFIMARVHSRRVTWFECQGDLLRLRVEHERRVREISLASLEKLERERKSQRQVRGDWVFRLHHRDGAFLILDEGTLSNLSALIERLGVQLARHSAPMAAVNRPTPPAADDERATRLMPYLEREQIVWLGRPGNAWTPWQLRCQALVGLVLLAGAFSCLVFVVVSACQAQFWALSMTLPTMIAGMMGSAMYGAARQMQRAIAASIYAVTDRRAIILGGFYIHPFQTFLDAEAGEVASFSPEQLLDYDLRVRDQAVILNGFWVASRRGEVFRPIGFLACTDAVRAAEAIEWLLESHGIRGRRIPVIAPSTFLGH